MITDVVAERTLLEAARVAFADLRRLVDSKGDGRLALRVR
jgi:hypothetical protein